MKSIKSMAVISLFTAIMCFLTMFIPPIPISALNITITMQTLVVMVAGITLKPLEAFISMILYILLGVLGLPVFSNFQSGPAALLGPTGGFIFSFPLAAFFISITKGRMSFVRLLIINVLFGVLFIYAAGILSFSLTLGEPYNKVAKGMLLFLIPDLVKVVVATMLGYKLKTIGIDNLKGL